MCTLSGLSPPTMILTILHKIAKQMLTLPAPRSRLPGKYGRNLPPSGIDSSPSVTTNQRYGGGAGHEYRRGRPPLSFEVVRRFPRVESIVSRVSVSRAMGLVQSDVRKVHLCYLAFNIEQVLCSQQRDNQSGASWHLGQCTVQAVYPGSTPFP